jgi:hypothetical protein
MPYLKSEVKYGDMTKNMVVIDGLSKIILHLSLHILYSFINLVQIKNNMVL